MLTHVHTLSDSFYAHTCLHMPTLARTCPHLTTHAHTCPHMPTHAHTCPHMPARPPGPRWPTCTHVLAHLHTSSHIFTPAHTCSCLCIHAYTCTHMLHMSAFPVPSFTGLALLSFVLCFIIVFAHLLNTKFLHHTQVVKPLILFTHFDMFKLSASVLRVNSSFVWLQRRVSYRCMCQHTQ